MNMLQRFRSRLSVSRDPQPDNQSSRGANSPESFEHVSTSIPPEATGAAVGPQPNNHAIATTTTLNPGGLSPRGIHMASEAKGTSRILPVLADPYDPDTNPNGYINFGVADNYNMLHHVRDFINNNLQIDAVACSYALGGTGSPRLKQGIAKLYNDKFAPHTPVLPENIQVSAGCTALCEMLGWSLGSPGDSVVLSAPIYGAFSIDFSYKSGLRMVHVSTGDDDPIGPNAPAYYEAKIGELIAESEKDGDGNAPRPRILLICTPHNPLGKCYDRATMSEFCKIAKKFDLHLVCDEVYAQSTFSPVPEGAVPFTSIFSIDPEEHGLAEDRIHVLYGFSKDIAAAGLRLGCLLTRNEELRYAMGALAPMHWASSLSDTVAAQMLEDREWLERYTAESQRLLGENYRLVTQLLEDAGIEYYHGTSAGFFAWINLAPFLDAAETPEAGEAKMHDALFDAKVWTNTGKEFSSTKPGWFRIVFAQEKPALKEGMKRLISVVKGQQVAKELVDAAFRNVDMKLPAILP